MKNYVLSTIFIVLLSLNLSAFNPDHEKSQLDAKAFSSAELYISTTTATLGDVIQAIPNRTAVENFKSRNSAVIYIDPRSGAIMNAVTSIPLIPGTGKGNAVQIFTRSRRTSKVVDAQFVASAFRKFLAANKDAYGIDVRQIGEVKATQINDYLWHLHAPQVVDGIPVRRARVLGVINHGNLVVSGTEYWGNARVDVRPVITAAESIQKGFVYIGSRTGQDRFWKQPTLEIIPASPQQHTRGEMFDGPVGSGYEHKLVWVFGFQRTPEAARWEMGVDAHTGKVLFLNDKNQYIDKRIDGGIYPLTNTGVCPNNQTCGTMQPDSPMPWANTGLNAPNDFTNGAGIFDLVSAANVTTTLSGRYVHMNDFCGSVSETSTGNLDLGGVNGDTDCVSGGSSPGNTSASRSGFYEVNKIAEIGRGYLPLNGWLQSQLTANMNIPNTCNAFWDGSTINFYQSGGGCRNTGEIAAVFDHEWGHGLDHFDSNGTLSDSSEGYADIASMYRLWASCVGYGFFETVDFGCGMTADGTGFNHDEAQIGPLHCSTDCSGVRDSDYLKHQDQLPDDVAFICNSCSGGGGQSAVPFDNAGPCGRQTHCAATPTRQAAWDFVARDLPAAGFDANTSFIIGDKLFYQGSGNIGLWHNCTCPSTSDGCGAANGYMQWLSADDDNGDLSDGTPHMVPLHAAFGRHGMACDTPAPTNSGCSGGPGTAPVVTIEAKHNQNILNWNSVANASSYFVFRTEGYAGCDFGKALIANVTETTYTDNEVGNGRAYSYVVMAVGSSTSCFTPASTCVQATPVPCAGTPEFTRAIYNCNDTITLQLLDSDLAGNGTQNVTIASATETIPETVNLTETAPSSGLFEGTINTTANPPSVNGVLSVTHGDVLTVNYNDVSACGAPQTTSSNADVDCVSPAISSVSVTGISEAAATVNWNTDEPANSRLSYALSPGPPSIVIEDLTTFVQAHSLTASSLQQCSDYVFTVESNDPAGNNTTDDNGGSFYTFTTTGVGVRLNDDLESGGANWVPSGPAGSEWHISTCQAFSGTQSFKAGPVDCIAVYSDDVVTTLTSANPFPLGPQGHVYHLTFRELYDVDTFDFARIQASTNNGASWTTLEEYNGIINEWAQHDIDLSAIGGAEVLIRFVLVTDSNPGSSRGWYIDDIKISRVTPCAGTLAHFDQTIADSCSGGGPGDNDGIVDPGESISMPVVVENTGLSPVTNITATLSTTTPGVTITSTFRTVPDIVAQGFATTNAPFSFDIDSDVGCLTQIDFTIEFTSNQGNWTDTFSVALGGGDPFSLLSEGFEAGIPATWTVIDGGSGGDDAATWTTANPSNRIIGPPFSGLFAIVDSDSAGPFATQDEQLITPSFDATTCANVLLDFSNQFNYFAEGFTETADVDLSTDGGASWTNVLTSQGISDGYPVPNTKNLDLTSIAAFQPDVQLRFHYYNGNFDSWWAIDNVQVTCQPRICQACIETCLFCDQFNDGVLATDWEYKPVSGGWNENGTQLVGSSNRKAQAIANPAFAGCDDCSVETAMRTGGGGFNRVWLLGWYIDKRNTFELLMKEEQDRWILKQRSGGSVLKKAKALRTINPNQTYVVRIGYDGTTFTVSIDGEQVISMTPAAPVPSGTVGFKVKSTEGTFDYITVN
jgi:hypothetical protein